MLAFPPKMFSSIPIEHDTLVQASFSLIVYFDTAKITNLRVCVHLDVKQKYMISGLRSSKFTCIMEFP